MTYLCSKCGRTFLCEETISFCPFCGTAYSAVAAPQIPASLRMVIGSDSERTVQEKYWRMARSTIRHELSALHDLIPEKTDCAPQQLDLSHWLYQQKRCRSTTHFKQQCDLFLQKISLSLRNADTQIADQASIDIDQLENSIRQSCIKLANTLQTPPFPCEYPTLVYDPIVIQKKEPGTRRHVSPIYDQLLKAIEDTKPTLYAILDENGIFVALSVLGNLSPESISKRKTTDLCAQLYAQAEKDYDPLFGEEYDEFVQTFGESIMQLANIANHVQELPELDENEIAKLDALSAYLSDWGDFLDITLDQLYQSQQTDMILVYKRLQQRCPQSGNQET